MPSAAKGTSQFTKLDTATVAEVDGQATSASGKELPQQAEKASVSNVELREAVGQINQFVQSVQRDLSFSMDETSGRSVIKVIDSESGEVVRQIPSEEVLAIATYIKDVSETSGVDAAAPSGLLFSDST